jgi:hypothetical protein
MSADPDAKVTGLQVTTEVPEQILRNALARCAEIRAEGREPYVVVLCSADKDLPALVYSPMFTGVDVACAARLQLAALDHMRKTYSEDGQ